MYSGETKRERDANFVLPIAKRQIMFSENECLQEGYCGFDPSILKEECLQSVSLITDAYPIVKYYSENTDMLNRFVKSITVAIISAKRLSFDKKKCTAKEEIVDEEVFAYITNSYDMSTEIYYNDLCKLLYQKPKLTVTDEGVLLFYTPTTLFATFDCKSGNIMGVEELAKAVENEDITKISSISVNNDGATVIKFKTQNGKKVEHQLSMLFDFFSECGVTVKIN